MYCNRIVSSFSDWQLFTQVVVKLSEATMKYMRSACDVMVIVALEYVAFDVTYIT